MCLHNVVEAKSNRKAKYGYKVFSVDESGHLMPQFYSDPCFEVGGIRRGRWLKAKKAFVENCSYETGFHVFLHKRDALSWREIAKEQRVFRVAMRGVRLFGVQSMSLECAVCDEIFVMEEVTNEKVRVHVQRSGNWVNLEVHEGSKS